MFPFIIFICLSNSLIFNHVFIFFVNCFVFILNVNIFVEFQNLNELVTYNVMKMSSNVN